MKRVHVGDTIFRVIGFLVAITIAGNSFAQTTYYSRNDAVSLPRQWDNADSWTLSADGTGPAAAIPQQDDHIVILASHSITINGITNNGGTAFSADGLMLANVGTGDDGMDDDFPDSNTPNFYHTGNISVEEGGSLIISTRSMFAGTTFVAGDVSAGADIINLGIMFFTATSEFSSNDDLILSGNSNTRIDIPNPADAFTNDDIYLDHTDAWLCGLGIIEVDIGGTGGIINLNNLATVAQICDDLTIIGCSSGPCAGTGVFNPTPPVLSGAGTTLIYIENAITQINPAMTLTYGELFLSSATVSLDATYVSGEDVLAMIPIAGITATFDTGSGTLTLAGYGTISTWESALQNVTYENLSDNPSIGTRIASFEITDGFAASNIETRNIDITPVNDPPDVSTLSGTPTPLAYTEGDGAVPVDDEIEVDDPDDVNLEGATITISTAFQAGEDVLAFTNTANITGSFAGNVMTLLGTAPIAEYQAALRAVTYENTSEDPDETTRTVGFRVDDGDVLTPIPFTRDIEVTAENDPPVISSTAPTTATEDILYSYTAVVNDPDDANDGTEITWSLTNEPVGMVVSSMGVVTWTPLEGVLTSGLVTLTVEDGDEDVSAPDTEDFTITVTPVNDPPVITSTAPTTATEETLYTYTATVTDPDDNNDGIEITWSLTNEPLGMVVSSIGVVTWTPAEGVLTSGVVTLSVEDGNEDISAPDTEDFTITVTPVNDPPVITSTAPSAATEDVLYTYAATVTDPDDANDGTEITWSLTNEPAGMVVSSMGVVTWTPLEGVLTSGVVTLTVEDGDEDVSAPDSEDFTITVTPVNDPPVITSTAPTTATEETLYTYTATVTDPDDNNDGIEITWSLTNEPLGMVVSSIGVVTWTPAEGVLTSGVVTLSVEDGNEDISAPDTEDFTITVTPVNDPPVITSTAPTTATEDVLYTYAATVTDPDDNNDGTEITWSLTNEPAGMVVSSMGVVTWTPLEGVLTSGLVTLTVEDGDEDVSAPDSEDFTITVTPVNDPPVITSTAPTTATEETLYTYTATVTDPDDNNDGIEITWSLTNEPLGMVVSSIGVVTWTPAEGVLTSGVVTLSVEDGNEDISAPDTEDFTITVTPVNDPPVITSTAPTTATEDVLYTYAATVTDPDDNNDGTEITWSLTNEPAGMVVSSMGVVTWTPLEGVLTSGLVTLTVEDGDEDVSAPDTEDFTITVTPVNDPPVITSTAPTTATEETLYTYTATVTDPDDNNDGIEITWSLTNEPLGMVVSSIGVVTWTPAEGVLTSGVVTLTVEDGNEDISAPDTEDFTIIVTPINDPPVITSSVTVINYTEGDPATLLITDAAITDGDDLNMEGAQVSISANFTSGEDVLDFTDPGGITGSFSSGTGILTLSGSAAITAYESAIQSITYENTSGAPNTSTRTISFIVNDGDDDSPVISVDVQITSLPEPPVILPPVGSGTLDYAENEGPKVLDATFTLSDLDDINLESATITISNTVSSEDVLAFGDQNGITGSFDAASGLLTLTGSASLADYQSAIRTITYENISDDPDVTVRTVDFIINDGESNSNTLVISINIIAVNDPPVVAIASTDLNYLEGSGSLPIDDLVTVVDLDNATLVSAQIDFGTTFNASQDVLAFTDQLGIAGSYDTSTGILTLTGSASLADYSTALASITYENTSINPDLTTRIASFVVNDGQDDSPIASRNITMTGTNEPPILVDGNGMPIDTVRFTINEDEVSSLCVMTSDPESNNVFVESVTSSSTDGSFDNGPATDLCFTFTPALDFNGVVYAAINICDDGSPVSCQMAVVEITVVPVNDPPVAVNDDYTGNEDVALIGNVLDNDSDPDGDLLIVNTSPVDPPVSGTLVLNADGSFTYMPATDFAGQDMFTYSVCDNGDPSLCSQANVTITLNDLEDPVIAYQLLTPNDDAFNDEWVVDGIEQFPQNNVQIFDRWSALVYKTEGYNNSDRVWKGESNEGISPDELPNGTYFYVIQLGDGSNPLQGFVELKR